MKASKQFDLSTELLETRQNSLQPRWKSHEDLLGFWLTFALIPIAEKKYKPNVFQYWYL